MFCAFTAPMIARHKQNNYSQQLQDTVLAHEPLKIDYKNIINPTVIGLSDPLELEKPRVRLTHEQKVEKYKTDKELRNIFHRHAYGLLDTDEKIFTSKQALNFFNMDIHEQKEEMLKWLKDHNIHQNNQLKEAADKYRKEIKNFKGSTQYDTLKNVAKIQKAITDRNDQIKLINRKLQKDNLSDADRQQKHQELDRLKKQNEVDDQSIQMQLSIILEKLAEIDQKFKKHCDEIIQDYQQKNQEILDAVNKIILSKKQIFSLKTADKNLPSPAPATTSTAATANSSETTSTPKKEITTKTEVPAGQENASVILSTPKSILAKNPLLDKIIERHEKDLLTMKRNHHEYGIMKAELKYLKEARNLRDIQGTSI